MAEGKTIVRFDDKSKEFLARHAVMGDMMLGLMAAEIEAKIKMGGRTPFKGHGGTHLRTAAKHSRVKAFEFKVEVPISYAAAQEAGHAGNRVFRKYTTPGTGKGWFKQAVTDTVKNAGHFIEIAKSASGIK